jgi:hypothetical protein
MIDLNPNWGINITSVKLHKDVRAMLDKLSDYGEYLGAKDVVNIGLYPSVQALYLARVREEGPRYTKLNTRTTVYAKSELANYIQNNHSLIVKRLKRRDKKQTKTKINIFQNKLKDHLIDVIIKALRDCNV